MALSQKLEFRQTQSLVMTPQLMQAIKLLQLSSLDLNAFVDAELERNPLLERDEAPEGAAPGSDGADGGRDEGGSDGGADFSPDPGDRGEATERPEGFDRDLERAPGITEPAGRELDVALGDLFPDDSRTANEPRDLDPGRLTGEAWSGTGGGGEDIDFDSFAAGRPTLYDHLIAQLALMVRDPVERIVGQALIEAIDDAGYLRAEIGDIAAQLGIDVLAVSRVLAIVQRFEPSGVGARSLAECLTIQLAERNRLDPAMRALIDHLDLVARHDRARLKRLCSVDDEDLEEMLAELKALDPKPGLAYAPSDAVQTVVPDVLVRPTADGYRVELNTDALPRVLVNRSYHATVARTARSATERSYFADCLQTANWLVKSLDQRAKTILKVATEIVRQQDAFFRHGVAHLRPLNLKTIAAETGMHESTVSRVTANKYMATTRGIFELKFFFTAAIASADGGEAHSAEAVRHRIRRLIEAESPAEILSDDAIVHRLREDGVEIARRTVAKYRESLGIASSMERRREKAAGQRAS
ncbi:RNA polymerase factor sigma-54 [Segnochrobactrum spirostomi]|uniref:RNA polymerase sigma-54 factor n=1 Tax=Segnochrobactrum spirostomi TaxID=2608987 RepID=A0A6A7Y3I8_9HYPH|nr:RNA polymerase factor sigma-54 [Segnochrobactrum spirostomi]MQT13326.1 RNA polymerase factor sigma-54 [Segnochrobactrum spirostomi]